MSEIYTFEQRDSPLLISIPHDGRLLAPGMYQRMTDIGRALPDTDWHVKRLYDFAGELRANVLTAKFSRYVVDLNRPPTDTSLYRGQVSTGLCPTKTFDGEDIYSQDEFRTAEELQTRLESYWHPYHNRLQSELERIRREFGFAVLWDAHSIRSQVPALFEGTLPDLNIGTNDGSSCHPRLQQAAYSIAEATTYSVALNGRFTGGYITRNYGRPSEGVHALQLELAQYIYMDENSYLYNQDAADRLRKVLRNVVIGLVDVAHANFPSITDQ